MMHRTLFGFSHDNYKALVTFYILNAAAVTQWVRAFSSQAEGGGSNPSCERPKSLKQVVTAPLLNARH